MANVYRYSVQYVLDGVEGRVEVDARAPRIRDAFDAAREIVGDKAMLIGAHLDISKSSPLPGMYPIWTHHVVGKVDRAAYPMLPRCSRCGEVLCRDVNPSAWPKEGQAYYAKQGVMGEWYYQQREPTAYESCLNDPSIGTGRKSPLPWSADPPLPAAEHDGGNAP